MLRGRVVADFAQPIREQAEGVVPKRIDLHCLSSARSDDPIVHLRIHPRKLILVLALREQAVVWINVNIIFRAVQMMFGDVGQRREKKF